MKIGVFHPGTQHSWQTALALQQLDRLEWFATSLFYKPDEWPYRLERLLPGALGARLAAEFRRIAMPALDPTLVRTAGAMEWLERIATRIGCRRLAGTIDRIGNERFATLIADAIAAPGQRALWGYSGSSLRAFEQTKRLGIPCILDRTSCEARAVNADRQALLETHGDWFLPGDRALPDSAIAIQDAEFALADHILAGCDHAARTIRDSALSPEIAGKLRVVPYGYDESLFGALPTPRPSASYGPVRFLYLGAVMPTKGVHHVLEAIAKLPRGDAELTVVGDLRVPRASFAPYVDRVTWHPTVARADVPAIMARHDVLLLPSYHEGAGIVLYEAQAAGLGVIQSDRCALVATERTGIVLERIDTDCLLEAMRVPIADRERLNAWRAAAQGEARRYSFANYRANIARFLDEVGL